MTAPVADSRDTGFPPGPLAGGLQRLPRFRRRPGGLAAISAAAVVLAASCAGHRRAARPEPAAPPRGALELLVPWPAATRDRIALAAGRLVGRGTGSFEVDGIRFPADCSGFVEAVYHSEGIPFREALAVAPADEGSAVAALYRAVGALGVVFTTEADPLPGDLVFWNDTYDRNGDGLANDPLTHVGLVEAALPGRTVRFVHRGARGVARGYMTLASPDRARGDSGETLNTPLRVPRDGDPQGLPTLAGRLFAAFGRFDPARLAAALEGSPRLSLRALGLDEGREDGDGRE